MKIRIFNHCYLLQKNLHLPRVIIYISIIFLSLSHIKNSGAGQIDDGDFNRISQDWPAVFESPSYISSNSIKATTKDSAFAFPLCAYNGLQPGDQYLTPYSAIQKFYSLYSKVQLDHKMPVACKGVTFDHSIFGDNFPRNKYNMPYNKCATHNSTEIQVNSANDLVEISTADDLKTMLINLRKNIYMVNSGSLPSTKAVRINTRLNPEELESIQLFGKVLPWKGVIGQLENYDHADVLVANLPLNARAYIVIFYPKVKLGDDFVIIHHGHENKFMVDQVNGMLAKGRTIAYLWMPLYGPNIGPSWNNYKFRIHADFFLFDSYIDKLHFNPMVLFVDPINQLINYIKSADSPLRYSRIIMVGQSGGGFMTHLYQAIDPRVDIGFAISGGAPLFVRHFPYNELYPSPYMFNKYGDYEMMHPSIFGYQPQKINHLALYILAAWSTSSKQRIHVVVRAPLEPLNSGLASWFYANDTVNIAWKIGKGKLQFIHDWTTCAHEISPMQNFLLEEIIAKNDVLRKGLKDH